MKEMRDVRRDGKARQGHAFLGLPQRRAECDWTVFRVPKGVQAFSFCKRKNVLLTGGKDRVIRVWNPYLPGKPTGILKSHTAPVIYIHVSAEDNRMFSMSTDNTIKIWDLETDSCLFTTSSKASGIRGEPRACLYLPDPRALCAAADAIALLPLRQRSPQEPALAVSHREPVVCCQYSPTFRQVVSCSEASVVKVWDCETGRLLSEFIGAHGNAGITCMTFDSSGRRLVTGGRDGSLKIWSYNNGHCLHTLKHDEKQSEICDCTYLEVNQNKFIIAVGWDRRINVYFDTPCDFRHFRKPQPHWQDDLDHGHKEDILCVAQCPSFLLATSSYGGEIIIWNVISGHVCCKLNTPSPSDGAEDREGPDRSVSCLTFLKTRAANLESAAASLITNGPQGSITFWRLFGRTCPIANFTPSKDRAQVSSMVVTAGDAHAYVADRDGFVRVYDIKEYGMWGPELQPPKNAMFWRAHVSTVTSLELIEEEKLLLSSSLDHTVCLWSTDGEYIGTFGQSSPWDIFTPASWSRSGVPCEVLTDPQSMPAHPALERSVPATLTGEEEQEKAVEGKAGAEPGETSHPRSREDSVLKVDMKEDTHQWDAFCRALCCHCDLLREWHGGRGLGFPKLGEPGVRRALCSCQSPRTGPWVLQRRRVMGLHDATLTSPVSRCSGSVVTSPGPFYTLCPTVSALAFTVTVTLWYRWLLGVKRHGQARTGGQDRRGALSSQISSLSTFQEVLVARTESHGHTSLQERLRVL
ncbi:WD repeat-containing protein 49-like [Phacochoerus africanus]|uniref:WD repeat-containing protein 49-like n=1 Tax=Phacochoerus africanus TaxID=41426 RepID=UPI001FD94656|nr:WD repeat-containing protein 49-like [Phacochoerus africanus]